MPILGENADMNAPVTAASRRQGALLLADISGYTGFLQRVADAHRALAIPTEGMLDGEEAYDGGPPFRVHLLVLTE